MRRRLTVTVTHDGATFVLRGWGGGQLARDAGLRPIFSGSAGGSGGWILDTTRLPDLLAVAQSRNVAVLVTEAELSTAVESLSPWTAEADADQEQLDLFGPDGGDAA